MKLAVPLHNTRPGCQAPSKPDALSMPSRKKSSKRQSSQSASRVEGDSARQELVITGEQAIQQAVTEAAGQQISNEPYEPPCTVGGLMAGLSGGALGYIIGFGEQQMLQCSRNQVDTCAQACLTSCMLTFFCTGGNQFKHKGPGRLRASHVEGWTSARVRWRFFGSSES